MTNVASDFKISLKSTLDGKQKNLQNLKLSLSDTVGRENVFKGLNVLLILGVSEVSFVD